MPKGLKVKEVASGYWQLHVHVIGASLSKPHIDHDNSPCVQNNAIYLSVYLSVYHLPRVCHTLVPEIRVRPEVLRVFQYIDMLMCVVYNCIRLDSKADNWSYSFLLALLAM